MLFSIKPFLAPKRVHRELGHRGVGHVQEVAARRAAGRVQGEVLAVDRDVDRAVGHRHPFKDLGQRVGDHRRQPCFRAVWIAERLTTVPRSKVPAWAGTTLTPE
jgi:metallophosphoesterase superfamily enzyme